MTPLSDLQVISWLHKYNRVHDPYHAREQQGQFYGQFRIPQKHLAVAAFTSHYLQEIVNEEVLLEFHDWDNNQPSGMLMVESLHQLHGESRLIRESPGQLLAQKENQLTTALFSLSISYDWSAYLYSKHTTLFQWEGELFDFWADEEATFQEFLKLTAAFGLEQTAGW